MFMGALVSLMILIGAVGPAALLCKSLSHSLLLVVEVGWAATGCVETPSGWVGITRGAIVFVGNGVGEAVSVGGTGVAVGMAACVSATIVHAAATAVPCTSSARIVGTGSGPHALISRTLASIVISSFFHCQLISPGRYLTVRGTPCLKDDRFVFEP
jgi:hypothetical protein